MTRHHDKPRAESTLAEDQIDRDDIGPLRSKRPGRRHTGYLIAGTAGAVAVIAGLAGLAMMSPNGIAQDNTTLAQDDTRGAVPKPRPAPRPKPAGSKPQQAPEPQQTAQPSQAAPAAPTDAAAAAATPETPFLTHARQAGLTTCGTVYPALGQILTQGSEYMVQSSWNKTSPNAFPLQALVGMNYRAGAYTGPAIGIVSASPNGARCDGDMVRIVPLNQDCQTASRNLPQGTRQVANLTNIPVLELPNGGGQVVMMAAGQLCVAVTVLRVAR